MTSYSQKSTSPDLQSRLVIDIVYYTDPLCCWSWALDAQLTRLEKEWHGIINWRYCMGGLLPAWDHYTDNYNSVQRPAQMGPLWMLASKELDIPIAHRIWVEDPPASSYPACIAVKCAQLQSQKAGKLYLYLVQKAVMQYGLNIARQEVLLQVAQGVAEIDRQFSLTQFKEDMQNDRGQEAFRKDLQEVKYSGINRFPSLLIKQSATPGILITGFKPAEQLLQIIENVF
ncbi:disulfide bond formation protein DsbA [Niastella yeongjuensis]|uniref:Disulfide bond formation protein DsbA n=1 Tax=Niastella yeongjuensis TaxID=354355 RepID=A0A1V9EGU5_9BACT|nr:DsbA family protein [Niastella yeongjuensis]OQP45271.1 disulfide bond formation protein DsbA [Niastella yeongjuensis]SEO27690.1 Predicted dithiol-disulfide isomerase, DsbA family [Niastella yeongjuensis]